MNKIFVILIIIILAGAVWLLLSQKEELAQINNFEECAQAGNLVMESYPRQCRTADGRNFTEDIGNELEKADLIFTINLRPNQKVSSPLLVEGEARGYWFFEASFPVKIYDANGNLLGVAVAQAQSDWMTEEFVPFSAILEFSAPATQKGRLVLERDNPSGLLENDDQLEMPIIFGSQEEIISVKAYFSNSKLDPEVSCTEVFPIYREISETLAVGRAALEELLKGPTEREKVFGFFTSINSGVNIQSLAIENGTASADFDEELEFQAGGSCRVAAIRAQITETLLQFSTVDRVIISIDGRIEDILQP